MVVGLLMYAACIVKPHSLHAQDTTSLRDMSPARLQDSYLGSFQNHAAWGIGYGGGDGILGRGDIMLSMLYARNITSESEVEFALHYLTRGEQVGTVTTSAGSFSFSYLATSFTVDASYIWLPLRYGFFRPLHIGIGPSLRHNTNVQTTLGGSALTGLRAGLLYVNTWATGFNFKVEYPFALSQRIEVALRTQIHWLFPVYSGEKLNPEFESGGSVSLGAFIRINW